MIKRLFNFLVVTIIICVSCSKEGFDVETNSNRVYEKIKTAKVIRYNFDNLNSFVDDLVCSKLKDKVRKISLDNGFDPSDNIEIITVNVPQIFEYLVEKKPDIKKLKGSFSQGEMPEDRGGLQFDLTIQEIVDLFKQYVNLKYSDCKVFPVEAYKSAMFIPTGVIYSVIISE